MEELRLVRRDDQSLIVATEAGEEYALVVDEAVLAELRQLGRLIERGTRDIGRVKPREVQALVRAGKSRTEIAELTGLSENDIERYEEPVLAERRYMLELAHAVAVRTSPGEESEEHFGTVIAERLVGLGAEDATWSSWRDEEAGWMIGLEFASHDVDHRAVWSFDHRKRILSPLNGDAENLSKQGDVGDRLIPKLRAVDSHERFDSGAFDLDGFSEELTEDEQEGEYGGNDLNVSGPVAPDHPSTGSIPVVRFEADSEFARRQNIEERAIKTPTQELPDMGQTADLLDALRRRRGERDAPAAPAEDVVPNDPVQLPSARGESAGDGWRAEAATSTGRDAKRSEWAAEPSQDPDGSADDAGEAGSDAASDPSAERDAKSPEKERRKGRASIPSWDDILFGTRSDEDPA